MAETGLRTDSTLGQKSRFFSTPGRSGLIQQLAYVVQFGEGLPVVQGESGSGKSFLADELLTNLSSVETSALISVQKSLALEALLAQVCEVLSVPLEGEKNLGELLALLRHFTQALVSSNRLAIIILDDAHNLDHSSLGAIMSLFQGDAEAGLGLRMIFFAQPGLVDRIDDLQLLDVPVFDFEAPLLSLGELAEFIKEVTEANPSEEELKHIWSQSQGNPGLALHMLSSSRAEKTNKWLALIKLPIGHAAALGLLVIVLLWALLVRDSEEDAPEIQSQKEPIQLALPPNLEKPQLGGGKEPEGDRAFGEVVDPEVIEPQQELSKPIEMKTVPSSLPTLMPTLAPILIVTPTPTALPTLSPPPVVKKRVSNSADEAFLLAQSGDDFTLQVLVASKSESLSSYMARQVNRKDLYLYRGMRGGVLRYVVVTGVYKSKKEALDAIKKLPAEQQKAGPWPRMIKSIKQEIAEVKRK